MFIAREQEMALLEAHYQSESFEMIPVWGRRRVGKTRLLTQFISGKPFVHFFSARETTARENLRALSEAVQLTYDPLQEAGTSETLPVFSTFEDALSRVFIEAQRERVVFVIDEYPYLAKSYSGVSSLLQSLIDRYQPSSKLMLILCGSSMSFMEHQVLGEKSPLYGRRTAQLRVEPFDYLDSSKLLGTSDHARAIELYSLVGGVPLYLEQLEGSRTTEWNIGHRLLGQGEFLYAEPRSFLLQEISSPAPYSAVIEALAHGRPRPQEIADATGLAAPNVIEYLKRLQELGIVRRETPVGQASKRQVLYRLGDFLFLFWYTFAPRYQGAIDLGQTERVARRIVQRQLSAYVGHAFEDVCRQWMSRRIADGSIDMLPSRVGSWWGTDLIAHERADVDVVALGSDDDLVCGECKWTSRPTGADVLETLERRARSVMSNPTSLQLIVFSKAGFEDSARREARRAGNVRLVTLEELFG